MASVRAGQVRTDARLDSNSVRRAVMGAADSIAHHECADEVDPAVRGPRTNDHRRSVAAVNLEPSSVRTDSRF